MHSATHIIPNTTIAIMMYGYPSKLLEAIRILHQNFLLKNHFEKARYPYLSNGNTYFHIFSVCDSKSN
jgi:hypothetical protein